MDKKTRRIIRRYQKRAPVDVIGIATALGLEVYDDDKLPDRISGMLTQDDEGFFIVVNGRHHPNRQRFTIAHEIAHYVLHGDKIGDGVQDNALYRSHLPGRLETEANRLAADILMPWDLIDELIESSTNPTVQGLAKKLKVSPSAMSIRLGVPLD